MQSPYFKRQQYGLGSLCVFSAKNRKRSLPPNIIAALRPSHVVPEPLGDSSPSVALTQVVQKIKDKCHKPRGTPGSLAKATRLTCAWFPGPSSDSGLSLEGDTSQPGEAALLGARPPGLLQLVPELRRPPAAQPVTAERWERARTMAGAGTCWDAQRKTVLPSRVTESVGRVLTPWLCVLAKQQDRTTAQRGHGPGPDTRPASGGAGLRTQACLRAPRRPPPPKPARSLSALAGRLPVAHVGGRQSRLSCRLPTSTVRETATRGTEPARQRDGAELHGAAGFSGTSQCAGLSPVPFMPLGVTGAISGARLRSLAVLGTQSQP